MRRLSASLFFNTVMLLMLIASCANPKADTNKNATTKGTIAAQLWTFRYELQKDVPGTLKRIKALGINYVEGFDAPYITENPDTFRHQLDAAGLQMFALHWNDLNDWRKDPTVIMETAKKLGARYTGIAWLKNTKADTVTLAVVNEAADILTKACDQAQAAGLQLYYHIHGYELQPLNGQSTFFDSFISRINYNCVRLEADVFWVTYAGQDPVKFMDKYRGGVELLHIKNMADGVSTGVFTGANFMPPDMPAEYWVPLGRGKIDYKAVFKKGREIGVKWYILEMDKYNGDVYAAVDSSLAYIKKENLMQ
ncbi:MAG TPA: sugar phosphate isomerase/epimerase [Chitinophagaceae bacterium]|nr:sugar phosphate isomerase/epimerase [Chitinophagaceae bacterium]